MAPSFEFEPYYQGSYEKSVVGPGKVGAPKDPAILDESPAIAYEYMVDIFLSAIAIVVPSSAVQVRSLEQRSSYPQFPIFRKFNEH